MIIFSVEKMENNKKNVKALFWADNSAYKQISIETILYTIKSFLSDEQKQKIKFIRLYHDNEDLSGTLHKNDGSPKDTFFALVKLINNEPESVLRISGEKYNLSDMCELLNEEVDNNIAKYQIFEIPVKIN